MCWSIISCTTSTASKVYDVVIDSISIVNNYRAQFERVIAKTSLKELLQKIKQQGS